MNMIAWLLGVALLQGVRAGDDSLWLALNVPAFRLELFSGETRLARYEVAPGAPRYPTPRGRFEIARVEWNPWWIPPDREWARDERPRPPGPDNPMGRVKLYFRPLYFLHGTPQEHTIGTAASHGCVRMRNSDAIALAELLLRLRHMPAADSVRRVLDEGRTRSVVLSPSVPLHISYDLVEVVSDTLLVHQDIYGVGPPTSELVQRVLAARRLDTTRTDRERLQVLLWRSRRVSTRMPLDSLFTRSP